MKKFTKLSLVAAVAVAGLSSANAQALEEAIKNVDVSGSVVYRYDNFDDSKNTSSQKNNYKIGLNLSSKVNDYVKFNSRFIVGNPTHGGFASLDAKDGGADGGAEIRVTNAYFGLNAIPNTTVNIGKQGLTTPYTKAMDINGNEQTGTGILAISSLGMFTVGAGHFNNTNIASASELNSSLNETASGIAGGTGMGKNPLGFDGGKDINVITAQADLDVVKVELWGLNLRDTFNTYTVALNGNYQLAEEAKIGFDARYVNLHVLGTDDDDTLIKLAVDGKFGIVNAKLGYAKTGKDGGLTALDQDSQNTTLGWGISINGIEDAQHIQAAVGLDILDNLNFTVNYGNLKAKSYSAVDGSDLKMNEYFAQLTYKMSKNLNGYVRFGQFEQKDSTDKYNDQTRGRLQVNYLF